VVLKLNDALLAAMGLSAVDLGLVARAMFIRARVLT
jgi:hypothetical protein